MNAAFTQSSRLVSLIIALGIGIIACVLLWGRSAITPRPLESAVQAREEGKMKAPELNGGVAWLNSAGPLKLKDLKGKIVVLDFWTLCCINCIHTLPDLAKLEKKYAKQLVVVGVHSPKFDNEKKTESIRKAILRYEISHPVVNDAEMRIWNAYGVNSWPTLAVIDPEGNYIGQTSGEGRYDILDRVITKLIEEHTKKKTLVEGEMRFDLARFREKGDTPLFFPGKILADAASKRLFIADSTHHRLIITDLEGTQQAVIGTGLPGKTDGTYDKAQFDDPQGMTLVGETLYVADRKNHLLRAINLSSRTVSTVAGTGQQDRDNRDTPGDALKTGMNSPWDLYHHKGQIFIAMAGHHQIWTFDIAAKRLAPYAGNGRENIADGPLMRSEFSQPSGLASDGTTLFVADSEISAVRAVPMDGTGRVKTLVGKGLFDFGDVDGPGDKARLQHALGVVYVDGLIYVADTYNSKIKTIDPKTRECKTFIDAGSADTANFNEPAGISFANGKLYVADTNAHRIQVVDLKTKTVSTLPLKGVEPPVLK